MKKMKKMKKACMIVACLVCITAMSACGSNGADGYAQQCGTYAELADAPEFRYLGDGKVTCKMRTENGDIYSMTLTLSADGSDIRFLMEDDLPK